MNRWDTLTLAANLHVARQLRRSAQIEGEFAVNGGKLGTLHLTPFALLRVASRRVVGIHQILRPPFRFSTLPHLPFTFAAHSSLVLMSRGNSLIHSQGLHASMTPRELK